MRALQFIYTATVLSHLSSRITAYEPTWESLDSRPLPSWYDEAKVGIFMHFGPYAVPGFLDEWFWNWWQDLKMPAIVDFMKNNYPPHFTYQDFGAQLKMEFFNASQFAELVKASGAKYLVFTSKHHDGFTNFPSPYTFGWNSVDIGPKRDVVGELRDAFKKHPDLHFGLYYSLFEWYNPIFRKDSANNHTTREYALHKMLPEMKYLAENYAPEVWWSDGDPASPEYFGSKEFLAWLFSNSPKKDTVVTNDRWGSGTSQKHGSFFSGPDRFQPGRKLPHKWENAFTIDSMSWGYRRNMNIGNILPVEDIVGQVVETVSCGGNALINVGPTKEGTIAPIFQERMVQLGKWLGVNGEAIYSTVPFAYQNDSAATAPKVWYTASKTGPVVYAIALGWPKHDTLVLGDVVTTSQSQVQLLGYRGHLKFEQTENTVNVAFPNMSRFLEQCGRDCLAAYSLKMTNVRPRPPSQFHQVHVERVKPSI